MSVKNIQEILHQYLGLVVGLLLIIGWTLSHWLFGSKGVFLMIGVTTLIISFGAQYMRKFLNDSNRKPPGQD